MDGEADAAGEYDRLRAELADFVLDALAQRMAAGEQPELSRALAEAIDRRVDEAVSARLAAAEWPDPDAFADSVIAAAAGRAGSSTDGESYRPRTRREDTGGERARRDPPSSRGMSKGQIALIALIGLAVIAAAAFFLLRNWNGSGVKTETINNVTFIEPAPDGSANVMQPPTSNVAAPTSAGALENVQGPTP